MDKKNINMTELFESIYQEARTTRHFNDWWFKSFIAGGEFNNKKVIAKIDFTPINRFFDDFEEHFSVLLYDPSDEKLPPVRAQEKALNKLRQTLQEHFENRMNNCLEDKLPDNVLVDDKGHNKIKYTDKDFTGPDESHSEFIIDVDEATPGKIKGTLEKTYRLKVHKPETPSWKIGRISTYAGKKNVVSESPYIKGLNLLWDKPGEYVEHVECMFRIEIITEEPSE